LPKPPTSAALCIAASFVSGLAHGFAGPYQINPRVPNDASSGGAEERIWLPPVKDATLSPFPLPPRTVYRGSPPVNLDIR